MTRRDEQLIAELDRLRQELANRDEQEGGVLNFLAGLALGTLAGGALALAFAPAAGRDMRAQVVDASSQLRDRANQVAGQVRDQAGAVQEQAQEALGQVKERAQALSVTTAEQVQALGAKARETSVAVQERVDEARARAGTLGETAAAAVSVAATQDSTSVRDTASSITGADQTGGSKSASSGSGSQATGARPAPPFKTTPGGETEQPELERHYGGESAAEKQAGR